MRAYLFHFAVERKGAAATQRQALNLLVFFYRRVLDLPLDAKTARAKRRQLPPVVLTGEEVQRLFLRNRSQAPQLCTIALVHIGAIGVFACLRTRALAQIWSTSERLQAISKSYRMVTNPVKGYVSADERRHYVLESCLQNAVKRAARRAGNIKRVGCHTLRHSSAIHMLEEGGNIRRLHEFFGHANDKATKIDTHVVKKTGFPSEPA